MGQVLRRFINRAPRYILASSDNQTLRFVTVKNPSRALQTQLINVSESGLGFIIDLGSAPQLGESIKMEFAIPGGEQIAWFGKVVRLEEQAAGPWWSEHLHAHEPIKAVVGIQFQALPDVHRHAIRSHLHEKFVELNHARRAAQHARFKRFLAEHGWKILMYTLAAIFTFAILYFLSLPSGNYDSKRGAPWGHRFNF